MKQMKLDWEVCRRIADRIRRWDRIWPQDGEDFIQDALLEMVERAQRNGGELSEAEIWRAARCVRNRYWRAYRRNRRVLSLNRPIAGTEERLELWETLADNGADLDALLDARARLGELPSGILRIGRKLAKEDPLTQRQQAQLARFRQDGRPSPQQVWERRRYHARRSQGLCVRCGQESGGFARCPWCQESHRKYQARHRRKKGKAWQRALRSHWRRQGRCPRCGRPPKPGRMKCPQCLTKDREHLRRWRERETARRAGEQADKKSRPPPLVLWPESPATGAFTKYPLDNTVGSL